MDAPKINKLKNVWLTSDTHFCHTNIIKHCHRPFYTTSEMNEVMIQNWNRVVKPGDIVYHLGDVFMDQQGVEQHESIMARLTGRKRLVVGNHDDIPYLSKSGWFQKVLFWRVWNDRPLIFTHTPLHQDSIHRRILDAGGVNVHGHMHNNGSPKGPYKSVCVELHNYTPVNLEDLL